MHKIIRTIKEFYFFSHTFKKLYQFVSYSLKQNHHVYVFAHRVKTLITKKIKIDVYKKQTIKMYCKSHNIYYKILVDEKDRKIYIPKYYESNDDFQVKSIKSPQIYSVRLENVSIIGGNSFILKDNLILYDVFDTDTENRYDLRFNSIFSISKKGEVGVKSNISDVLEIEKGIFMIGFGSFNYYHFTVELMSRFKFVNESKEFEDFPLIIDDIVLDIPQFNKILESMNESKREIIYINKNRRYMVKNLGYISDVSWLPINVKDNSSLSEVDFRVSNESIEYLRNQVMKVNNGFSPERGLKIYLSRKSNYLQRLINEREVASIFKKYGYEIIYPEELSLKEQIKLFSASEIVVGATGAALTNIIYCK